MSVIIEDEIFVFSVKENSKFISLPNKQGIILNKFLHQSQLRNRNFQIIGIHQFREFNKKCMKFIIAFKKKLFNLLDVWYVAMLDQNAIYIQEKLLIAKDQLPYQIAPFKKKLLALKQICRTKIGQPKYSKIYITQQGTVQILIPKFIFNQNVTSSFRFGLRNGTKSNAFSSYVQNMVSFILSDCKLTLKNIFSDLNDLPIKQENAVYQLQKQAELENMKFELYRYLVRSPIQLRFDCTEGSALYEQVVDITITEEKQIEERIKFMRFANQLSLSSLSLYSQVNEMFEGKQREAFYMTAKEKQTTKNLLQIPQIIPVKQGQGPGNMTLQNKYMFNNIVLELPRENQKLILLAESGFGRIQFGSFNFWYLMNSKLDKSDMQETLKQSNKIKKKYLVVKSPKVAADEDGFKKYHSKQMHQINIINRLKGLSCALIPRFYQVQRFYPEAFTEIHQQYIQKYEHALLSQLTSCYGEPGYNMGNFIEERWSTLTFKKIVYIMSQVAQALRFLHLNKIVHLDLKPQNILFLKNFSVKLIDFGESFHPLVSYQDSPPAYTYPYGCPEIAQKCLSFPDKSDVFSFGIILYQLLYGKDIITTSPEILLNQYARKGYSKRIFFNPEQLENYGQNFVLPMLNHLIIKSLSPEIQSRPSMTWISVLLKNYLQILH